MTKFTCNIIVMLLLFNWLRDRFKYHLQINEVIYYTKIETIMFLNALESSADRRWTSSLSSTYPAVIIFTWIFPPNPRNKFRSYRYKFRNLLNSLQFFCHLAFKTLKHVNCEKLIVVENTETYFQDLILLFVADLGHLPQVFESLGYSSVHFSDTLLCSVL